LKDRSRLERALADQKKLIVEKTADFGLIIDGLWDLVTRMRCGYADQLI